MNNKQRNFIEWVKRFSQEFNEKYGESYAMSQLFAEKFTTGDIYSLDPDQVDPLVTAEELEELGVTYADLKAVINMGAVAFTLFYTNQDVITREYGKFFRSVMNL